MMGILGFHLSSSMSPIRDTLSRNRGRREVDDSSLWRHTHSLGDVQQINHIMSPS